MKLQGKVIVITGGTRGIGRAVAEAAAREGAKVVVCGRDAALVESTVAALQAAGGQASGIRADVASAADLKALLDHADATWGRVDVWFNNAGISIPRRPFTTLEMADVEKVVAVNLFGVLQACHLVLPYLIKQGGGTLINMTGRGGEGGAAPNSTAYGATKAAVTSLTLSLAAENRQQPVSIHVLSPGMVPTDFYRAQLDHPEAPGSARVLRLLHASGIQPETVAKLFVEIAAQPSGAVTGRVYRTLRGRRRLRAACLMAWYRLTGKL